MHTHRNRKKKKTTKRMRFLSVSFTTKSDSQEKIFLKYILFSFFHKNVEHYKYLLTISTKFLFQGQKCIIHIINDYKAL